MLLRLLAFSFFLPDIIVISPVTFNLLPDLTNFIHFNISALCMNIDGLNDCCVSPREKLNNYDANANQFLFYIFE